MTYHVTLKPDGPYQVAFAETPRGGVPARDFLNSLPERPRKKTAAWLSVLEEKGPNLPRPYADVLSGPIRELRVSFGRLEIRMLYFIHGRRIIMTHGFLKKTPRVPESEIARAERTRALWFAAQKEA